MKRFSFVLLTLCLLLVCVFPVGAYEWHGQSFLGDYYGNSLAADMPSLYSASISVSSSDVAPVSDIPLVVDGLKLGDMTSFSVGQYFTPFVGGYSSYVSGFPFVSTMSTSFSLVSSSSDSLSFSTPCSGSSSGNTSPYWAGLVGSSVGYGPALSSVEPYSMTLVFDFQTPVTAFELDGVLSGSARLVSSDGSISVTVPLQCCSVLVNSASVYEIKTGSEDGRLDFNHFIYDSPDGGSFSSFSLQCAFGYKSAALSENYFSGTMFVDFNGDNFGVPSVEGGGGGVVNLDKFNEDNQGAQDSMGAYDEIENQWSENMTASWDSLNISDFSFDNGLVSAFALFTGIFNDIWTIFGFFSIFFIFPLLLGLVLTIIGRLSRTGGKGGGG